MSSLDIWVNCIIWRKKGKAMIDEGIIQKERKEIFSILVELNWSSIEQMFSEVSR
jgi:hypothetical protein